MSITQRTIVQSQRQIALATPLGKDVLALRRMEGSEALGRMFQYHLDLMSSDDTVRHQELLGENVTIRLALNDGGQRFFNGHISRFVMLGYEGHFAHYEATVVPWLWFLSRTADCRIFQHKSVPEIITAVFREHGFTDFEDTLKESYRAREYMVQYRETDLSFVNRLMEHEGIYYFFRHENGKHTLILADSSDCHSPCPGYEQIPYYAPGVDVVREQECLWSLRTAQEVQSGAFALNDFDFTAPKKSLRCVSSEAREHTMADFEYYDYPGAYYETAEGDAYSRIRIEELQTEHEVVHGEGDPRGLLLGGLFELTSYPRNDQNREYLVVATNYNIESTAFETGASANAGPDYQCQFTAIDAKTPFRPRRVTPKPVVQGPQTAIVVGKSGEEIWTDKYGRVKVQFHWDRYGKADENSSCWIRVSEPWAGKKWGGIHLPRIGQEVIVECLEGDPDRPIITGRVYNGATMPPYDLPGNQTMSTVKSSSSKGGGGFNELRFEDRKGEEQIFIHAERNQDIRVKNDTYEWIGNERHLIVKKDQIEKVDNDRHENIARDHFEEIGRDRHVKITGKEAKSVDGNQSRTVKGNAAETFKKNHSEQVTQNYYHKAMGTVIEASTGITLKCGSNSIVIDSAGVTIKGTMLTLDGSLTKIASGPGSPPMSGKAGRTVKPAAPKEPAAADLADPGEVAKIKARQQSEGQGKHAQSATKPHKPPQDEQEKQEKSWIEVELVDEEDQPVPGERYEITLPDGKTVASGTLDENGFARVDGIDPGTCQVTFPELDKDTWESA